MPVEQMTPPESQEKPESRMFVIENGRGNFNCVIWVKVTPTGEAIYEKYWRSLAEAAVARRDQREPEEVAEQFVREHSQLKRNAAGWTEMPLYDVMAIFGKDMVGPRSDRTRPLEMGFRTEEPTE